MALALGSVGAAFSSLKFDMFFKCDFFFLFLFFLRVRGLRVMTEPRDQRVSAGPPVQGEWLWVGPKVICPGRLHGVTAAGALA